MKRNISFCLFFVFSTICYSQIGYKYENWIKGKEYLVGKPIFFTYTNRRDIADYIFKVREKLFTDVIYQIDITSKKIITVIYLFPSNYQEELRRYCNKNLKYYNEGDLHGFTNKDEVIRNQIFINSDETMLYYLIFYKKNELTELIVSYKVNNNSFHRILKSKTPSIKKGRTGLE
jgi:hypothetical protein